MADFRRLPAPTTDEWIWQSRGACLNVDTSVFFHPDFERGASRAQRTSAAKAVCARCPVLTQCREHALRVQEPYGTWGGLDELERKVMIKEVRRQEHAA